MRRNHTSDEKRQAWLSIGEHLELLSWQKPEPMPYRDDYICTITCMEGQLSPRDLAFIVHGDEGERATYPGCHVDDDGEPDYNSDYFLNKVECKSPVPSQAAISEGKNPLLWMADAEQELQDEFKAELAALGVSTQILKRISDRLFGTHDFPDGFIGRMEPAPVIIDRLFKAWRKVPSLRGISIPNKALSKIHRLCELRHDIKSQREWWQQGSEPGDEVEVYDEWADIWRGADCVARKLSGASMYADWGISNERQEELDEHNEKLMVSAREVRGKMDAQPTLNTKLFTAREYIKDAVKHKTPDGKRTIPFHIEHKLMGIALACLRQAGASAQFRLADVCRLWSFDGRMYGTIPYSYKGTSLNCCSDSYLARMEDVHAKKVKEDFNAHIGQMRTHWEAMEATGMHLLKVLDDPNYKLVKKHSQGRVIHKREAIQLTDGSFITKVTRPGDILFPLPIIPEEIIPEDVDVEYLEHIPTDIDQEWVLDGIDNMELWEE